MKDELVEKVKSELRKINIRHRGVERNHDSLIVRAEARKDSIEGKNLESSMRRLKLRRVTSTYGRWEFKRFGL